MVDGSYTTRAFNFFQTGLRFKLNKDATTSLTFLGMGKNKGVAHMYRLPGPFTCLLIGSSMIAQLVVAYQLLYLLK
jgi:hypothetical protein